MASTKYTYSVANDTLNSKVSPSALRDEIDADVSITVGVDPQGISVVADVLDVWFKASLSAGEKTALDSVVAAHDGVPPKDPTTADGKPIVRIETELRGMRGEPVTTPMIPSGDGQRWVSHNFCDKLSWYQESVHVVSASMVATGSATSLTGSLDNRRFVLSSEVGPAVDVRHGRLVFEDTVTNATQVPNGNTLYDVVPAVAVTGTVLDPSLQDDQSHPDGYTIDYAHLSASVVFNQAQPSGSSVTLSFRRPVSSKFTIQPKAGKRIVLEDAEVDLSEDFNMLTPFTVCVKGSHSTLTGGTVVPLETRYYKKFHDFHAAARKFWGPLPSGFGGDSGISSPKWTFQWEYMRSDDLYDTPSYVDQNLDPGRVTLNKLEVSMGSDVESGGSVMTIAFFGAEVDE